SQDQNSCSFWRQAPCTLEEWADLGQVEDYLSVLDYLLWVFTPLVIVFIVPFLIVILLYLSILFLHVYKRKNQLREAYCNNLWDGARKTLATLWDGHGAIWHETHSAKTQRPLYTQKMFFLFFFFFKKTIYIRMKLKQLLCNRNGGRPVTVDILLHPHLPTTLEKSVSNSLPMTATVLLIP
uniref:Transmembrane protein 68 n=1 Tax=Acanthochromis polyacanthus TaxID=80966 RepID=A0A3Q1EGT5_9TELE